MGPSGWFTLAGIGEPIAQARHLIKDLWYRNRQERERGDMEMQQSRELHRLEVLKRAAELCSEHGEIVSGPASELAADVLGEVRQVELLEIEGKVRNVETDTEET